jgi:hypothetical protein
MQVYFALTRWSLLLNFTEICDGTEVDVRYEVCFKQWTVSGIILMMNYCHRPLMMNVEFTMGSCFL